MLTLREALQYPCLAAAQAAPVAAEFEAAYPDERLEAA